MSLRSWGFKSPLAHQAPEERGVRGVDFFDDETGRAPDDAGGPPSAPPSRRRPDRRRTRIQRLAILALVLFIVVFGLAWWARSCQQSRKIDSYRTYFDGVGAAISDSDALGKQVSGIMKDPAKLSRKELVAKLGQLSDQQDEIAVRAARLEPPGTLEDEQTVFATGMKVRARGFQLLRTAMLGAIANKKVGAGAIAALDGYFSGPDAYYQELVYAPSRDTMAEEGVSGVAVPTSTYYLTWKALDPLVVDDRARERGQVLQAHRHPRRGPPERDRAGQLGRRQARQGPNERRAGIRRPRLRRRGPEPGQRHRERCAGDGHADRAGRGPHP